MKNAGAKNSTIENILRRRQLANKIVVIGYFGPTGNTNNGAFEKMTNAVLLINTYLDLVKGTNPLNYWMPVYLFVCFSILSYFVFYNWPNKREGKKEKKESRKQLLLRLTKNILKKVLSKANLFLLLISLVNFILFNTHINFLTLAIYFNLLLYIKKEFLSNDALENIEYLFEQVINVSKI